MNLEKAPTTEKSVPASTDARGRNFVDISVIKDLIDKKRIKKQFTCAEGTGSLTKPENLNQKFPKASEQELKQIEANYGNRLTRVMTEDGRILYSRFNENTPPQEEEALDEVQKEKIIDEAIVEEIGPEITPDKIEKVRKKIFINPRVAKAISVAAIFIIAAYTAASMYGGKAQEVSPTTGYSHVQTILESPRSQEVTSIAPTIQTREYPIAEIGEEVPNEDVIYKGGIANWTTLETPEEYNQLFGTKLSADIANGRYSVNSENPNLTLEKIHNEKGVNFKFVATLKPLDNPKFDPDSSNWEGVGYMELPGHYDSADGSFVLDMEKVTPEQLKRLKQDGVEIMWQAKVGERNVKSGDTPVNTILGIQNE